MGYFSVPISDGTLSVCLAASGGGHLRQLLDLENAWGPYNHFFVTEDTALSQSLAEKHEVHCVAHVALGQARLGTPGKMLKSAIRNFVQSFRVISKRKPDLVITTGAGTAFAAVLWGRFFGATVILIESFARFERPSAFARIASPFAHSMIVQSEQLSRFFPKALIFDPLRRLKDKRPEKSNLLVASVGATLPFDRLVENVAKLKRNGAIPERLIVQTGVGGTKPDGVEVHETLPFETMQNYLKEADIVVCHGGTGSVITALRSGCRVVVMPRLFELGEHYDEHQLELAQAFEARGLIVTVKDETELATALEKARRKEPVLATTDMSALSSHISELMAGNRFGHPHGRNPGRKFPIRSKIQSRSVASTCETVSPPIH